MCAQMLSHTQLLVTPWTVAHQAPLSMGVPSKNTGVGCHFLLQGIFLTHGSNLCLLHLLPWQVDSLPVVPPGKPCWRLRLPQLEILLPCFLSHHPILLLSWPIDLSS